MKDIIKKYTKDGVTVIWEPSKCIHSTICWKGLVSVFNPRAKPWVNMDGAALDEIKEQVARCPSGALSYVISTSETTDDEATETTTAIEAIKNGPLLVYGNIKVKDAQGHEAHKSNVTAFCRCGASKNKPFCDGSHITVGFSD